MTVDNCNASILVLVVATVGSGICMITNQESVKHCSQHFFVENRSVKNPMFPPDPSSTPLRGYLSLKMQTP